MIGKTNIPMGMLKGETVSILLKTNQSSNEDLNGVKVVVSYDDESHEYTYNGQFSVEIPNGKAYTVSFGEVDGYKTPSSVTYTAVKGFSRSIETTYYGEKVTVNVSAEGGADVDDKNVTVEKQADISVSNGVYILDTDGKYWNTDDWDNSATPNCIAVITDEYKFGISASRVGDYLPLYSDLSITLSDLPMYTTNDKALADYYGKANTEILKKYWDVSDTSTAFGIICNYSFPDGRKAYIGSAGEWDVVADNYTLIKAASDKIGGNINNLSFMWTSTAYDSQHFYYCRADGSYFRNNAINDPDSVYQCTTHAFCSLTTIEKHTIQNGKASFSVPYDETYTVSLSDMDGYTTPESQTYTAAQPTREISMEYKKAVEHLVVNVSSDDNAVSGYEINIFKPEYEYIGENNEYLKLDYIESTGEQWIDTGYKPSALMRMEYDVQFTSTKGGYNGLYLTNQNLAFGANSNLEFYFSDSFETVSSNVTERNSIVFDTRRGDVLLNNSSIIAGVSYYEPNYSLPLFALMRSSGVDSYAYMKLYSFKIYRSSTLERNYIPVMRMSDGIVGLYEELNGDFLQSETDVNFKAGFVGYVIGTQTSATGEYDIPLGTEYMITASDVNGYITPASQTFTAEAGTRTVDMVYEAVKLGVFIQGVSGKLYETDAWTSQETANGVAVITEECSFVIALTEASDTMLIHSSRGGALENYMTAISNVTQAGADYDGATNTANIMKLQSGTNYAAGWCNAFSFPSGKKGFLPSFGQMGAALNNKAAVDAALTKVNGTPLATDGYYWTSTFWGVSTTTRYCWTLLWGYGSGRSYLSTYNYVRAFCSL